MKILSIILLLLTLVVGINAQCVLSKTSCGELTVKLTNVPYEHLVEEANLNRSSDRPIDEKLLTYVLEKEVIAGVWKGVANKNSDDIEIFFDNLQEGVYRVTCLVSSGNRKKMTRIQKEGRKPFSLEYEGFSSSKIFIEACDKAIVMNTHFSHATKNISISPNPTKDKLFVNGIPKEVESVTVNFYSMSGNLLFSHKFSSTSFEVDVSSAQNGIFFIEVKSEDNSFSAIKKVAIVK